MRVLLLHNRYRSEGGEERAVADLEELLRTRGHVVERLERSSASLGGVAAARGLLAGGLSPEDVSGAVRLLRADVVHAHNVHPLFGWRALAAAREAGARTVLHLHNFRLFCAIAVAYRNGAPCFQCRGADTRPGLRHNCRGSLPEAAVYAVGLHRQQPHLYEHADRFVTVSHATAARLTELGLPAGRTSVLPNFVPARGFATDTRAHEGEYALISGRLVEEKGFDVAIAAAREVGAPLVVAGEGPDQPRLRALAQDADVRFTGRLPQGEMAGLAAGAAVVLVPSISEEACPYSALDALASGIPLLASDRGGLPELVGVDAALPARDVAAWSDALDRLWHDPPARERAGRAALADARERFGEDRYYDGLLAVYGWPDG